MYEASNRNGQMWIRTCQNRVLRWSLGLFLRLWGVWGWTSSTFVIFNVNFFVNIFKLNFFETKITSLPTSPSRRYPHDHNNQRRKSEGRKKKKKLRQYPTQAVWSAWIVIVFVRTFHSCLCLYLNNLNKSDLSQLHSLAVVQFRCLKVAWSFFEKFSNFFWIFNGENTLFTKSSQTRPKVY